VVGVFAPPQSTHFISRVKASADPVPPRSSLNLSKEESADLRETMMRDFLALIPKFDPSLLKTPQSITRER